MTSTLRPDHQQNPLHQNPLHQPIAEIQYRTPGPLAPPAPGAETKPLVRTAWPWAGLVAGLTGVAGTLLLNLPVPEEAETKAGVDAVFATLDNQSTVRIGASLGFVAVYALAVFAAGFGRHVTRRAPAGSLIPAVIRLGLTGGVGSLIVGFGLKCVAAGGMPGGIDQAFYTKTDATVSALLASQMQWVGWQGVAIAMAAVAVGSLRHRMLPRWIGGVGALFSVFVAAFTIGLCLPYSAGIVAPVFLVLLAIALLAGRSGRQSA